MRGGGRIFMVEGQVFDSASLQMIEHQESELPDPKSAWQ